MGLQSTSFVGFAQTTLGTNVVTITATDYSSNSRTNRYQVVITNNSVARTLTYDLNGNETSSVTATATNTYEWDAADRLVAINSGINRSEFTYDGLGRRVRTAGKANGGGPTPTPFSPSPPPPPYPSRPPPPPPHPP